VFSFRENTVLNYGNFPSPNFVVVYDGIVVAYLSYSGEVPNLKALADIMNAEYSRNEHGAIIKVAMDKISNYFDTVEGEDR
jgi:hypothetical protein